MGGGAQVMGKSRNTGGYCRAGGSGRTWQAADEENVRLGIGRHCDVKSI